MRGRTQEHHAADLHRRDLGQLGRRDELRPTRPACVVDDRIPCDREQPARIASALWNVGRRRAPNRRERPLGRVLGSLAIAQLAQSQPVDRAGVAPVEDLERFEILLRNPAERLTVRIVTNVKGGSHIVLGLVGHRSHPTVYAHRGEMDSQASSHTMP